MISKFERKGRFLIQQIDYEIEDKICKNRNLDIEGAVRHRSTNCKMFKFTYELDNISSEKKYFKCKVLEENKKSYKNFDKIWNILLQKNDKIKEFDINKSFQFHDLFSNYSYLNQTYQSDSTIENSIRM